MRTKTKFIRDLSLATGYLVIGLGLGAVAAKAEGLNKSTICPIMGETAANIMTARQNEAPISDMRETLLAGISNPDLRTFFDAMILNAYKKPAYRTQAVQAKVIAEYRNEWELSCYTLIGGE